MFTENTFKKLLCVCGVCMVCVCVYDVCVCVCVCVYGVYVCVVCVYVCAPEYVMCITCMQESAEVRRGIYPSGIGVTGNGKPQCSCQKTNWISVHEQ